MSVDKSLESRIEALELEVAQLKDQIHAPKRAYVRVRVSKRRTNNTAAAVMRAINELGGYATVAQLRQELPQLCHSSLRRSCLELCDAGELEWVSHGKYRIANRQGPPV